MSFEDQLRGEFGQAGQELQLDDGSIGAVKRRARLRTRRVRVASGAALVSVGALFGALAVLPQNSAPEKVEAVSDAPDADAGPSEAPAGSTVPVETTMAVETAVPAETTTPADTSQNNTLPNEQSGESAAGDEGLLTEADLVYLGAFRAPADAGDPGFEFGGRASAFNPGGDPDGTDGFAGSLFLTGFARNELVGEISIPQPALHDGSVTDLPIAELLQAPADVTGGRGAEFIGSSERGGLDDFRIGGLEVVTTADGVSRLHWTAWQYFNVGYNDVAGHGHASLDLSQPDPQGPWYLGDFKTYATAGYLFSAPESFAEENLAGKRLIAGFQAGPPSAATSWGPPFFAFDPPDAASPESRIDATELVNYPYPDQRLPGFEEAGLTPGADWLVASDGRQAIVTVGNERTLETDCGQDPGTDRSRFGPRFSFYDPADFAQVAAGRLEPSQVRPIRRWDPSQHLIQACGLQLSSISFDESGGRLYVVQVLADTEQLEFEPVPVVHVFEIR